MTYPDHSGDIFPYSHAKISIRSVVCPATQLFKERRQLRRADNQEGESHFYLHDLHEYRHLQ